MKQIKSMYADCYSAHDWLECCKRKTIVKCEINNICAKYMLFSTSGDFRKESWKKFKTDLRISPATLNVLLTSPGEDFFMQPKFLCKKNKSVEDFLPHAAEFFRIFLANKKKFEVRKGNANFKAYNLEEIVLGEWHTDSWTKTSAKRIKIKTMDFQNLPRAQDATRSSSAAPYFFNVLKVLKSINDSVAT